MQETAYLIEAVDYYNEFINGASSIAAVNNWDNQFYATSLLLWQLTGNTTYEDKVEVRRFAFTLAHSQTSLADPGMLTTAIFLMLLCRPTGLVASIAAARSAQLSLLIPWHL